MGGKMKRHILLLIIFFMAEYNFAIDNTTIYGRGDYRTLEYENIVGTSCDSVTGSASVDYDYEIRILSVSGSDYRCQYRNQITKVYSSYTITPLKVDSINVPGFKIYYSNSLSVGDRFTFRYDTEIPIKIDSLGGVYNAFYTYMKMDSILMVSATPDTILLTGGYKFGLTIYADENIMFRTNKITNWIYVRKNAYMFVPILIGAKDTMFVKSASTFPDFQIFRGK